ALNCGSTLYAIGCSHAPPQAPGSYTTSPVPAPRDPKRQAIARMWRNTLRQLQASAVPGSGSAAIAVSAEHSHDGEFMAARAADLSLLGHLRGHLEHRAAFGALAFHRFVVGSAEHRESVLL